MTDTATYALLAAGSYSDLRPPIPGLSTSGADLLNATNQSPLPPGWVELTQFRKDGSGPGAIAGGSDGFSARVYQGPDGEIVISYGGTEAAGVDTENASLAGTSAD